MNRLARARRLYCIAAAVILAALSFTGGRPVQAGPLTYTLTVDTVIDSNTAIHQICTQAANDCSLRGAISFANRNTLNHYVLVLSPGLYMLALAGAGEDDNATGDLDIATDLIIQGNGATIHANQLDRVLDVHAGNVLLENLTLTGGAAPVGTDGLPGNAGGSGGPGGGIRYSVTGGSLTLKNCRVASNSTGAGGPGGSGGSDGAEGGAGGPGGGIFGAAQTSITLDLSQVERNRAGRGGDGGAGVAGAPGGSGGPGGAGGGIFSLGAVTLDRSSVSYNQSGPGGAGGDSGTGGNGGVGGSGGPGGGIYAANFNTSRSMFESNVAANGGTGGSGGNGGGGGAGGSGGGGVILGGAAHSALVNSTLYNNAAGSGGDPGAGGTSGAVGSDGEGGGLLNLATTTLNFVTITQNVSGASAPAAQGYGGGLANHGSLSAMNSIIADNFRAWDYSRDDCYTVSPATPFVSHGHNLFSTSTGCIITYPTPQDHTDLFSTHPGLLPAAYFGGPTRTAGLTAASPALNVAACVDWNAAAINEDQRGFRRPIGSGCDSGAFEGLPPLRYFLPLVGQ